MKMTTSTQAVDASKCVLIIDRELPLGLMVNTAGVLAASIGNRDGSIIGSDVVDGSGETHAGIVNVPIPILSANADKIRDIRAKALELGGLFIVDFTETAQREVFYEDYVMKLGSTSSDELRYLGVAIYGPKKVVTGLTGNLPLLR